jgi:hypothetical protein
MDEHPERSGNWTAMVAISPIRRYWAVWLHFWYPFVRGLAERRVLILPIKSLIRLSMIGFARWSVFDRVPAPGGEGFERLPKPCLLFETNFDGDSDEYLEAFCLVLPWGMRGNWWGAYGVPNVRRVSRFVRYVNKHKFAIAYYYSAYPDSSTKRIRYARKLACEIAAFNAQTAGASAEGFQRAYHDLLAKAQRFRRLGPDPPREKHTEALSVLTRVEDGRAGALKTELERLREEPPNLPGNTHFARWAVVDHLRPLPKHEVDPTSYCCSRRGSTARLVSISRPSTAASARALRTSGDIAGSTSATRPSSSGSYARTWSSPAPGSTPTTARPLRRFAERVSAQSGSATLPSLTSGATPRSFVPPGTRSGDDGAGVVALGPR